MDDVLAVESGEGVPWKRATNTHGRATSHFRPQVRRQLEEEGKDAASNGIGLLQTATDVRGRHAKRAFAASISEKREAMLVHHHLPNSYPSCPPASVSSWLTTLYSIDSRKTSETQRRVLRNLSGLLTTLRKVGSTKPQDLPRGWNARWYGRYR
jgi:hypothetical protein